MARNFKNIKAWQLGKELVLKIYRASQPFPQEELYGVTSQVRRAAVSVVTNIAEGASRQHKRDYLNFLYNAKASLSEVECLLQVAVDLNYLTDQSFAELDSCCREAASTLFGLIKSVKGEVE